VSEPVRLGDETPLIGKRCRDGQAAEVLDAVVGVLTC
jgi:hypothetical protein